MAAFLSTTAENRSRPIIRRAGAALLMLIALAAVTVHGKTGRGPKPVLVETAEICRFVERPQNG